jgi:hypothetical protein
MTRLAKRVRAAAPRHPEPALPAIGPPAEPVTVGIRLPRELLAACADDLAASVHEHVSSLLGELGVDRAVEVAAGQAPRGSTVSTVSIDRRPVAHLRGHSLRAGDTVSTLCDAIVDRTLRRLPLLVGPAAGDRSSLAYLADLGCRMPGDARGEAVGLEAAERLIDARSGEEIVLEVAAPTLRRVESGGHRVLVDFREIEYRKRGVAYPDVRVVPTDGAPGSVRIRLNDVTLPVRQLGESADWPAVVRHLGDELSHHRHWFVRMRDVSRLMDSDLAYLYPDLVAVVEANYSRPLVTACMRELVRSGRRMRNFPRIMWLLLEQSSSPAGRDVLRLSESPLQPKTRHRPRAERDPVQLAARVRKLAAEESWRLGNYRPPRDAVRLDAAIEDRLALRDEPGALASAEWAAVRAFESAGGAQRVVTRTIEAIAPVRDALQAADEAPRVMASQEMPPDADLSALRVLADPRGGD